MAQAGLGYVPVLGQQAGLNEPDTMENSYQNRMALQQQGYSNDEINSMLGAAPLAPEPEAAADDGMGMLGVAGYGAQTFGESLLSGAEGFVEDRFGDGRGAEALGVNMQSSSVNVSITTWRIGIRIEPSSLC